MHYPKFPRIQGGFLSKEIVNRDQSLEMDDIFNSLSKKNIIK